MKRIFRVKGIAKHFANLVVLNSARGNVSDPALMHVLHAPGRAIQRVELHATEPVLVPVMQLAVTPTTMYQIKVK